MEVFVIIVGGIVGAFVGTAVAFLKHTKSELESFLALCFCAFCTTLSIVFLILELHTSDLVRIGFNYGISFVFSSRLLFNITDDAFQSIENPKI